MTKKKASSAKQKAVYKGTVVSVDGMKTAVVAVTEFKKHSKYQKQYRSTKKFKIHDPESKCEVGQVVTFKACRPQSRGKHHVLVG